jgi:hypothetical protein
MPKPLTATELRANLYRVLDEVAETGIPREIKRGERILLILPATPPQRKLEDLPRREVLGCTIDELIETSWDEHWLPDP